METNRYPEFFAELIYRIRKEKKMTQIEFYNFLFPGNGLLDENIKKKMNAIEHGKQKHVDWDLLLTVCEKCDVSADYILGLQKDYTSHEREFICEYTGLEENAVIQLHKWNMAKHNGSDLSMIDEAFIDEEGEEENKRMWDKQTGIEFLKIINYLFKEGTWYNPRRERKERFTNLTILYALYELSMMKPEIFTVHLTNESLEDHYNLFNYEVRDITKYTFTADATKGMIMQDSSKVWHPFDPMMVLKQHAKNALDEAIDRMINQIKKEEAEATANQSSNTYAETALD